MTTCGGVRVGGGTTTKPRLEAVSKGGHDRSDMTTEPGFLSGESGPATDLEIRRENQDDRDAISQVVAAAFGSEAEARLVEAIRASSSFVPELSLVALLDHRVVGHVMVSAATLRDGENLYRIANLSPLAVAPDAQRRGVGSALVRAVTSEPMSWVSHLWCWKVLQRSTDDLDSNIPALMASTSVAYVGTARGIPVHSPRQLPTTSSGSG